MQKKQIRALANSWLRAMAPNNVLIPALLLAATCSGVYCVMMECLSFCHSDLRHCLPACYDPSYVGQ